MVEIENIAWPGWDIGECIGKGGYGVVYEIRREVFGDVERCALKVITIPKDASEIEYMRCEGMDDESITTTLHAQVGDIAREYKMMSRMRENPNIVHCDDFRYTRHQEDLGYDIYIKMELLTPLMKALDRVSTEEQIIRLGRELCNGLAACQKYNIIHRDIKPQNIFLSPEGCFKLGDFGIARTMEHTTRATAGIGTYSFMAPEVANGKAYSQTVDIYSLGLVLYWLLNERRAPFVPLPPAPLTYAANDEARVRRYAGEQIPPPKHGSEELKKVVLKACAYEPEKRYQTAREMMEALDGLRGAKPKRPPEPNPEEEATALINPRRKAKADKARAPIPDEGEETVRETASAAEQAEQERAEQEKGERERMAHTVPPKPRPAEEPEEHPSRRRLWPVIAAVCAAVLALAAVVFLWRNGQPQGEGASREQTMQVPNQPTDPPTDASTAPQIPTETITEEAMKPWAKNVMKQYERDDYATRSVVPGGTVPRKKIVSVTFLDTLADAPDTCWDMSETQNRSVLAWLEENNTHLYIAGEGGVNGELAAPWLFFSYTELREVHFNGNFHTENAVDFSGMFIDCGSLTTVDIHQLDTSHVENMSSMFAYCGDLTELDVSGFDTSNVTDMNEMFFDCSSLTELDVSGWDTSKVTNMSALFACCDNLTEPDVSGWDTSNVTDMSSLFDGCSSLTSLDVSGFDTSNVTNMNNMFSGCSSLTELDLSGFDTSNVTNMNYMFFRCSSLTNLDLSKLTTSNVTTMTHIFMECGGLENLDLTGWDTSKVQSMYSMFSRCSSLKNLDVSGFDTSVVTDMEHMFHGCSSLTSLDVSGFDTSNVADMRCMFFECGSLTDLDVSGFDTSCVKEKGEEVRYANFMDAGRTVNGRPWEALFA